MTKIMKRGTLAFAVIAFLIAPMAIANIAGTKHDFSVQSWSGGQICLPCHTPHGANKTVQQDAPLWNHTITTATYTVYSSVWLNASVGQPDGVTKLCLSCHDGTVAVDAYKDSTFGGGAGTTYTSSSPRLDRSNAHPISFVYDSALAAADGGLWDPTTTQSGFGGTIDQDMLNYAHKVQCTSCHEPHNKYNNVKFLRKDNVGSSLCLTCHNK